MNPKDIPALNPDAPVILEMHQISKTFGAVTALVDVSIKLRRGEVLALVGDNGAGKSTLIKILSGFHHPDCGTIILPGQRGALLARLVTRAPRASRLSTRTSR